MAREMWLNQMLGFGKYADKKPRELIQPTSDTGILYLAWLWKNKVAEPNGELLSILSEWRAAHPKLWNNIRVVETVDGRKTRNKVKEILNIKPTPEVHVSEDLTSERLAMKGSWA